jgi:hypothetical protein
MSTSEVTTNKLRDYRIERYEELGFSHLESEKLADALGPKGFALDWHKVQKSMAGGCTHRQAIKIYT